MQNMYNSTDKAPKAQKQAQVKNPTLDQHSFAKGSDSPPSVSLTASPVKTTEKKLVNLSLAAKSKILAPEPKTFFECLECDKRCQDCQCREACFLQYKHNSDIGNCSACGAFQDRTAV